MPNTVTNIVARHAENALLRPTLPAMRSANNDVRMDQPTVTPVAAILQNSLSALEDGETHYADVPGVAPLREKLATYLQAMGMTHVTLDDMLAVAGIQECRFLAIQMMCEQFGQIGIPAVVHPGVRKAVGVRHFPIHELPVDEEMGFLPTLAGVETALASGCRLLYLESPSRLSGATYDADTVTQIAALMRQHDGAVIWDQGMAPWVADYTTLGQIDGMNDHVVVLGEAWPGVGLESWPIGYISAKADWLALMRAQKQTLSICTSTPSQYAAIQAADEHAQVHDSQLGRLTALHEQALAHLQQIDAAPMPGNASNVIALQDTGALADGLTDAGFLVTDGAAFGAPGTVRLAVTPDGAILRGLEALS